MTARSHSDRCPTCKRRYKRNTQQNSLLWALYHAMAAREWAGQRYSADQFHAYYKTRFLGADDMTLPNGRTLTIPRSTADLSVDEFAEFYDRVAADCAERGVYLEELPA